MGGRGATSGINSKQMHMKQYEKLEEIKKIIDDSTQIRESGEVKSSGAGAPMIYKHCFCCRKFTLTINSTYETCYKCGWIDDEYQNKNPDSLDGKNEISLNQAREEYEKRT